MTDSTKPGLDDRIDRILACSAQQEPRVEDDHLGARRFRDSRRVVEHPDRHVELLAALGVAHEAGDRRMDREDDVARAGELAQASRKPVVHPELALEVDLAGVVAALLEDADRLLRALAGGDACRTEMQGAH